ncbi:MAG: hypothetical protein ACFCUR_20925 [Rhodomicrobiaceae bacterium]
MNDEIKALVAAGADGEMIAAYMNAELAAQSGTVAERGPHEIIDRRKAAGLITGDAMTAGTWPYIGAAIQGMTGHDDGLPYEDRRRAIQEQTALARQQHPAMSGTLDMAAPMVAGGIPAARARTVSGAAGRAAAGAGAYGAVEGYAAPVTPDSGDVAERLPGAMQGGLVNALLGYGAVKGGAKIADAAKTAREARTAAKAQEAADQAAQAKRRSEAARKASETRRRNKELTADAQAEQAVTAKRAEKREAKRLAKEYETNFRRKPKNPAPNWEKSFAAYKTDRADFVMKRVEAGRDIFSISREINLSPAQIARFVNSATVVPKSPKYQNFIEDVVKILKAETAFRKLPSR